MLENKQVIFVLFYTILIITRDCDSLKSLIIRVPEMAKSGDTVTLACEYDLEQVALYTIKWYRNEEEFYRFVPKESPPSRAFSMPHINVDISRSGPTEVTLRGVRRELTGDYKCEVSADAPLFHTEIKAAHMTIAEIPSTDPALQIEPTKVEIGKTITAECFSPGSDPPANITWYINDEKIFPGVAGSDGIKLYKTKFETDKPLGLHSSHSKIEIIANRSLFTMGPMMVRCETNIYTLWNRVIDGYVRDETPLLLAPVLGSTSSQSQTNNNFDLNRNDSSKTSKNTCNLKLILIFYLFIIFMR